MSASGRMAKKIELKRKWEDRLRDYKEPILYLRAVLTWKRPIDYGVFIVLETLALWFYFSTDTTVVTLASLLVVFWAIISWITTAAAVKFPWHLVATPDTGSSVDHFGDLIGFFVQLRFAVVDTVEDMQRFKAANPLRFVLQITVSGLVLAYIGSLVSGQFLIVSLIYTLLLLPGAVANGVPEQVAAVTEPHIKVYREKLGVLISKLLKQVDQQIKKARKSPTPTATPSSSSSTSTSTSTTTSSTSSPSVSTTSELPVAAVTADKSDDAVIVEKSTGASTTTLVEGEVTELPTTTTTTTDDDESKKDK